jgi:hypothetical protein
MNKRFKKRWTAELLSGKFKQGTMTLRTADDKYCCLGVACVISGIVPTLNEDGDYDFDGEVSSLPIELVMEKQIGDQDPSISPVGKDLDYIRRRLREKCIANAHCRAFELSVLNDNGFTFKFIARMIDKYL